MALIENDPFYLFDTKFDGEILKVTEKAVNVGYQNSRGKFVNKWIPKSILEDKGKFVYQLPKWFMEKEGLGE